MPKIKNSRTAEGKTVTFRPWNQVQKLLSDRAPKGGKVNRSFVINDLILKGAKKETKKSKEGK